MCQAQVITSIDGRGTTQFCNPIPAPAHKHRFHDVAALRSPGPVCSRRASKAVSLLTDSSLLNPLKPARQPRGGGSPQEDGLIVLRLPQCPGWILTNSVPFCSQDALFSQLWLQPVRPVHLVGGQRSGNAPAPDSPECAASC